jgi:hypothetical protein
VLLRARLGTTNEALAEICSPDSRFADAGFSSGDRPSVGSDLGDGERAASRGAAGESSPVRLALLIRALRRRCWLSAVPCSDVREIARVVAQ